MRGGLSPSLALVVTFILIGFSLSLIFSPFFKYIRVNDVPFETTWGQQVEKDIESTIEEAKITANEVSALQYQNGTVALNQNYTSLYKTDYSQQLSALQNIVSPFIIVFETLKKMVLAFINLPKILGILVKMVVIFVQMHPYIATPVLIIVSVALTKFIFEAISTRLLGRGI